MTLGQRGRPALAGWAWEVFITEHRRRRPGPACRRGNCSSPWRSAGAQGRLAGVGVVHHRAAAVAETQGDSCETVPATA